MVNLPLFSTQYSDLKLLFLEKDALTRDLHPNPATANSGDFFLTVTCTESLPALRNLRRMTFGMAGQATGSGSSLTGKDSPFSTKASVILDLTILNPDHHNLPSEPP